MYRVKIFHLTIECDTPEESVRLSKILLADLGMQNWDMAQPRRMPDKQDAAQLLPPVIVKPLPLKSAPDKPAPPVKPAPDKPALPIAPDSLPEIFTDEPKVLPPIVAWQPVQRDPPIRSFLRGPGPVSSTGPQPPRDYAEEPGSTRSDAGKMHGHRERAAAYLQQRCGPVNRSYITTACSIPKGSMMAVFDHPLFVVDTDTKIVRLVESRDTDNIERFQRMAGNYLRTNRDVKERELIQHLQLPQRLVEVVFNCPAFFTRSMNDGTIRNAEFKQAKETELDTIGLAVCRDRITEALRVAQPRKPAFLAAAFGYSLENVNRALEHESFERTPEGIVLSKQLVPN